LKKKENTEVNTIKTARKNNWIIAIGKTFRKSICDTRSLDYQCYCWVYDTVGLRVLSWYPPNIVETFNAHAFTRYRERMKLAIDPPIDLVKEFMRRNRHKEIYFHIKDGHAYGIRYSKEGIMLGEVHAHVNFVEWRTFVSRDLMHRGQETIEQNLINKLHAEIANDAADPYRLFKHAPPSLDRLITLKRI
jgi:hypothetical protein